MHPDLGWGRDVEMRNRLVPYPCVKDKNSGGISQDFSARKISPITFGCKNQRGLNWWMKMLDSQEFLLKDLYTDLPRLTPSELQHWVAA